MRLSVHGNLRQQQAASLADFDVFWLCAVLGVLLVFLLLLMKRSVVEKGAHVGGIGHCLCEEKLLMHLSRLVSGRLHS